MADGSGTDPGSSRSGATRAPVGTVGIVLAAGGGRRYGAPKQFQRLGGRRLVDLAASTARIAVAQVIVVLPEGTPWDGPATDVVVGGGQTRAASVRRALAEVPDAAEVVVVHDAAHPLASPQLFAATIDAVRRGAAAAAPVLPLVESLKRVRGDRLVETVPRQGLVLAQTPQAFRADVLRRAHRDEPEAVDDCALVEALGGEVAPVPGDPRNVHVTTTRDLAIARALLDGGHDRGDDLCGETTNPPAKR